MAIRPEITRLIGENLHSLPHEDGRPRRLMHYSQFGKSEDVKRHIQSATLEIGECIQQLLIDHGYTITHERDPKPADAEGYKIGRIKCAACGKQVLELGFNHDLVVEFPRMRLTSITKIKPECPHT